MGISVKPFCHNLGDRFLVLVAKIVRNSLKAAITCKGHHLRDL